MNSQFLCISSFFSYNNETSLSCGAATVQLIYITNTDICIQEAINTYFTYNSRLPFSQTALQWKTYRKKGILWDKWITFPFVHDGKLVSAGKGLRWLTMDEVGLMCIINGMGCISGMVHRLIMRWCKCLWRFNCAKKCLNAWKCE